MTDSHTQSTYQIRLGWGRDGLTQLAASGIVVIVDAIDTSGGDTAPHTAADLTRLALALPHTPAVFSGSLRNRTATAQAIYDEQLARGGRTSINLVLVGDRGRFAVEDYLAAGAIADALTSLGIDHSAPDVAVAAEGFRPLTRAVKHLFSASASGQQLAARGEGALAKHAAELDADTEVIRAGA